MIEKRSEARKREREREREREKKLNSYEKKKKISTNLDDEIIRVRRILMRFN